MSSRKERFLKAVQAVDVKDLGKAEGKEDAFSLIGASHMHPSSSLTSLPVSKPLRPLKTRTLFTDRPSQFPPFRSSVVQTKHQILTAMKELRRSSSATLSLKQGRTVYRVFCTLAEEKGYYQEEMQLLVTELKRLLFLPRSSLPPDILSHLIHQDVDILVQEDGLLPHYYLVQHLLSLIQTLSHQSQQSSDLLTAKITSLESNLTQKDEELEGLKVQIRRLNEDRRPMEVDRERLKEKCQKLTMEGDSLRSQLKRLEEKYTSLKHTLQDDMQTISELEDRQKHQKQVISDLTASCQALESDHSALIAAFTTLQDQNSVLTKKLKETEEKLNELEEDQRQMEAEKAVLRKRAAGGFEELTPRVQFEELYDALGAERPTFTSTAAHVTELTRIMQGSMVIQSPRTRTRKKTNAPTNMEVRPKPVLMPEESSPGQESAS